MTAVKVLTAQARAVRAWVFLAHGQRMETWLPAGRYIVEGEVDLSSREGVRAIMLTGTDDKTRGTWYVRPDVETVSGIEVK